MKIKGTEVGTGRPLICVPVLEKTKEEVIKEVEYLVKSDADMIEWRLDAFEHYTDYNEVREILQQIAPLLKKKLFLYTFRTAKQGGVVSVDRETLNDLHDLAAESECVDLIDLEFFEEEHAAKRIREIQKKGKKVVASHHDLEGTPQIDVMRMLLDHMCEGGADIVKLVVTPKTTEDVLRLLAVTSEFHSENQETPIITVSMGKLGGSQQSERRNFWFLCDICVAWKEKCTGTVSTGRNGSKRSLCCMRDVNKK